MPATPIVQQVLEMRPRPDGQYQRYQTQQQARPPQYVTPLHRRILQTQNHLSPAIPSR